MNLQPADDAATADATAQLLYDAQCDALNCPTPKEERVELRHYPPMQDGDGNIFVIVPDDCVDLLPDDPLPTSGAVHEGQPPLSQLPGKSQLVTMDDAAFAALVPATVEAAGKLGATAIKA